MSVNPPSARGLPEVLVGVAPRVISASRTSQAGEIGPLLSARPIGAVFPIDDAGAEWARPRGLSLSVAADSGAPGANVLITCGNPEKGVQVSRLCTLTRRGAWIPVTGWRVVTVEIVSVGSNGTTVGYAWTAQEPPDDCELVLVETVAATATGQIPEGAQRVALSASDAGWQWVTNPDGAPLTMNAPQAGGGDVAPVLGGAYVATVANVATWYLRPPA